MRVLKRVITTVTRDFRLYDPVTIIPNGEGLAVELSLVCYDRDFNSRPFECETNTIINLAADTQQYIDPFGGGGIVIVSRHCPGYACNSLAPAYT